MTQQIGFVGLGAMGSPMAQNLLAAGFDVVVYNRTAAKAEPLVAKGAHRADRPGDVAHPHGIVVSMLADDASLESLVMGEAVIAERLSPHGIHISMTTVSPAMTRKLAKYHEQCGSVMVAAPVFGRPEAAAAKKLFICASGPKAAKDKVKPVLEAMGQAILDFGDDPGGANVVKVAGNFMIAAAIEAMGEALTMVEKSGVSRTAAMELLSKSLFACPVYQIYGAMVANRMHTPAGFRLPLGLKDVDLALQTATQVEAPMPLASLLHDRFVAAIANGRGEMDWSALALGASDDAGLRDPH
jgi:3-hydroxyisobutyrate dehydrogenase-like beta-hydroxyacid dehydrogenase